MKIIQEHEGFRVMRGDTQATGAGIKTLVLLPYLRSIKEVEVVYTGCYYGHSALALSCAAHGVGKWVTLFLPTPEKNTYTHERFKSTETDYVLVGRAKTQDEAHVFAKKYAEGRSAHLLPLGFDCKEFIAHYVELIQSWIQPVLGDPPEEVWVTGGSGVSARSLIEAWPQAQINVVNLGVRPSAHFGNPHKVWNIPEKLSEEAKDPPPWPSASYYDAKMWQVVREHAKPGALIWNIA